MTPFDLVFLAGALATIVTLGASLVAALRGRGDVAGRRLGRLAMAVAAYLTLVNVISPFVPRRVAALGEDICADDWCIAATGFSAVTDGGARTYSVTIRLSSRAKRVNQREHAVVAYLKGRDGRRYDAIPQKSDVPFDTLLGPGDVVQAVRVFSMPDSTAALGVVFAHEHDFGFPRCCILGQGLFYKFPMVYAPAG